MCIFYKVIITKLNILVTKYPLPCVIPETSGNLECERGSFYSCTLGPDKDSFEYPELGKTGNLISATL